MDASQRYETAGESFFQKRLNERPFGKDHQAKALREAYTRICGTRSPEQQQRPEFVLLTGASGTGKTTVAESLKRYVTSLEENKGVFIAGKYDRFHNQMPFSGLISAFSNFASQVIAEGGNAQHSIRELVKANENVDRRLLVDVVPDLQSLLGGSFDESSSDVPILSDAQKQRCCFTFTEFVASLTDFRPIVMFLDDLQWCDQDSLDLLNQFVSRPHPGFMILGACRGNEVSPNDPLSRCLRSMEAEGVIITEVVLKCLDGDMVSELVSSLLDLIPAHENQELSDLLFSVTNGNFFHLTHLISQLHLDNVIYFERGGNRWRWNRQKLQLPQGGSVDLIRMTMERMPESVQTTLKTAASIGSSFSLKVLRIMLPLTDVARALEVASKPSFVVRERRKDTYRFVHDQIQEAAYSMIPEHERAAFHLSMLRKLWEADEGTGVHWTYAVGQLTKCTNEIESLRERGKAASLLLKAGRKACSSSAFGTALAYLKLGIDVLGQSRWKEQYDICLTLHNLSAEVAYAWGDMAQLDALTNSIVLHSKSYEERGEAYSMKILSLGATRHVDEAIELGLEVLSALGEKFKRPSKTSSLVDVWRTRIALRRLSPSGVLNLPLMTDPKKLVAMKIINLLFVYAKLAKPDLALPLAVRMVKLTLRHGLSAISACGFATFSIVLASGIPLVRNVDDAYNLSKLSLRLLDKFESTKRQWLPRVYVACYGMVFPWKEPITYAFEPLLKAYKVGVNTGDVEYGLMAALMFTTCMLFWSTPLHRIGPKIASFRKAAKYYKQDLADAFLALNHRFVNNLVGESEDVYSFCDPCSDQSDENQIASNELNFTARQNMLLGTAWIALFMGDWDRGEESLNTLAKPEAAFRSSLGRSAFYFLSAMFAVALLRQGGRNRKRYSTFRRNFRRIRELAQRCPTTFFPMQLMMEAEDAARAGKFDDATNKYALTMKVASKDPAFHCEGLAAVRLGQTLDFECRNAIEAREAYVKARTIYEAWGANVVVDRLNNLIAEIEASR